MSNMKKSNSNKNIELSIENFLKRMNSGDFIESADYSMFKKLLRRFDVDKSQVVGNRVIEFLYKFNDSYDVTSNDLSQFLDALKQENMVVQKACFFALIHGVINHFTKVEEDIQKRRNQLKESILGNNVHIDALGNEEAISYKKILFVYALMQDPYFSETLMKYGSEKMKTTSAYIHLYPYPEQVLTKEIPFLLNLLNLNGELKQIDISPLRVDISKPFGELSFSKKIESVPASVGIKDGFRFFKFQSASKISMGDTGNTTALGTDGKKLLFLRRNYSPITIFSSKIARRINPKLFSSERIMTTGETGSRLLPFYQLPLNKRVSGKFVVEMIKENAKVLPGMGIVDEVCSFLCETDPNIENLAISSSDLSQAYFSKIDFDRTAIGILSNKSDYQTRTTIRRIFPDGKCSLDPLFQQEMLSTRLEEAMFTWSLLELDATKSRLFGENRELISAEISKRSDMVLELLRDNGNEINILADQPNIVSVYRKIIQYFLEHDAKHLKNDKEKMLMIINDVTQRAEYILDYLFQNQEDDKSVVCFLIEKKKAIASLHQGYNSLVETGEWVTFTASKPEAVSAINYIPTQIQLFYLEQVTSIQERKWDNLADEVQQAFEVIQECIKNNDKYLSYPVQIQMLHETVEEQLNALKRVVSLIDSGNYSSKKTDLFNENRSENLAFIAWLESLTKNMAQVPQKGLEVTDPDHNRAAPRQYPRQ